MGAKEKSQSQSSSPQPYEFILWSQYRPTRRVKRGGERVFITRCIRLKIFKKCNKTRVAANYITLPDG